MQTIPRQPNDVRTRVIPAALALAATISWLAWSSCDAHPTPSFGSEAAAALPEVAAPITTHTDRPERRVADDGSDGYYTAPTGSRFVYAMDGCIEYALAQSDGAPQSSGTTIQSEFRVTVVDRRDGEILVEAELHGLRMTPIRRATSEDAAVRLETAASKPFDVRLADDGRVRGYRFAPELDGEQRNFVRAIFSAYVHTVPANAKDTWETHDSDSAGEFIAHHTIDGDALDETRSVTRKKLRYEAIGTDTVEQPPRVSGASRATFSRRLGWVRQVDVDERSLLDLEELGLTIDVSTSLRIRLTDHGRNSVRAPSPRWDGDWQPASGIGEEFGGSGDEQERAAWRTRLANESLDTLLSRLTPLLVEDPRDEAAIVELWHAITWLVQLRPEVAAEIRGHIATGVSGEVADILLSALGAADGAAGESTLSEIRRDSALSQETRDAAILALAQVDTPSLRCVGALVDDLRGSALLRDGDENALLLLGALSPRTVGRLDGGASAFDALVGFEATAQSQDRLPLWLDALGNAGTPAVIAHAARHARSSDNEVRAAAYHALRKVPGAEALALLFRGLDDSDAAVRERVVEALSERDEPAAADALLRSARWDADDGVRRAALVAIASLAAPGSALRRELEALRAVDPCKANRDLLRDLLQG